MRIKNISMGDKSQRASVEVKVSYDRNFKCIFKNQIVRQHNYKSRNELKTDLDIVAVSK